MVDVVNVAFRIRDSEDQKSSVAFRFLLGSMTITDVGLAVDALTQLVEDVIAGVIEAASWSINHTLIGGLKTTPSEDCDIQKGAMLAFSATGTAYRHSIRIPTWLAAYIDGDEILDNETDPAALVTWLTDGALYNAHQCDPCDQRGADLAAYLGGGESIRGRPRVAIHPPQA
jgi:hypothetical protein